ADFLKYGRKIIHHFCKHCGTQLFGRAADGTRMAISVAVLDDLPAEELAKAPVRLVDGIHDNFKEAPAFSAHL
ncbi:MAG TPA: GFA family protein, partial [Candidatus Eisenbacteria bacterium]|nr:GFA family protein [Candidatus Eisenbacteria bacterium]